MSLNESVKIRKIRFWLCFCFEKTKCRFSVHCSSNDQSILTQKVSNEACAVNSGYLCFKHILFIANASVKHLFITYAWSKVDMSSCFFVFSFCYQGFSVYWLFSTRYPEKHWNTEKMPRFGTNIFLFRHAPRIKEIPKWKYLMCIQQRNYDFSVLFTEIWKDSREK